MGFHDERLPSEIDYGYRGGPGFQTVVQGTASGHEERITRWGEARHRYRCNKSLLTPADALALKDFFLARRGALHSFPFKDWNDFTSASDGITAPTNADQEIGTGNGSKKQFRLLKTYNKTGISPYIRSITLTVISTVVVALDGVNQTSGWTVSRTGLVTFTSAPGNGVVVTAGFEFDVPVRFAESVDQWMASQQSAYQLHEVADIELHEVLDETELPDPWDPGGSYFLQTTGDVIIGVTQGRLVVLENAAGATRNVYLPAPTYLAGGVYWTIQNASASTGSLQVRDDTGATVGSAIAAGGTKTIGLLDNGTTKTWVLW